MDKKQENLNNKVIEKLKIKAEGQDWLKEMEMALRNPAIYPKFPGGKGVVLDILATLNTGEVDRFYQDNFTKQYDR